MKKVFYFIIFIISIFAFNVYASNDVEYKLTITDDFKFKEVISYSISDYKQKTNGYNYFSTIVNEDIYTDIFYRTAYKKSKVKTNNIYKVKLSHTYNEYSLSNSNFLNNCFETPTYDYDIDTYTFKGRGEFYCLKGDSLKITIITDMDVTSTNAVKSGNKYTWTPTDNNFEMNIKINKKYKESEIKEEEFLDDIHETDDPNRINDVDDDEDYNNSTDNQKENDDETENNNSKEKNSTNYIIVGIVSVVAVVTAGIIISILKQKNSNLNKI